jgi:hypothetical protein
MTTPPAQPIISLPRLTSPVTSQWFSESTWEPEEWLVKPLIPARSYSVLFARYGGGKSFLALHLACCGATGRNFLGATCKPFGTLYAIGEKASRFGKRIEAWKRAHGENDLAVRVRHGVPNLLDADSVAEFIAEVNDLRSDFAQRGAPLGLIVFDTLARCLRHKNVSDADAAGTAIEAIQRIMSECGVTVLPLGHVAKAEGSISAKGAGEWEDAADALLRIEREAGNPVRTLTVAKQSDEADGKAYGFTLDVVEVGETRDGDRVTSCVVRDAEAPDCGTKQPVRRLNAEADQTLRALARLEEAGQVEPVPFCPGAKLGTKGVRVDRLRSAAYEMGLQKGTEPEAGCGEAEQKRWFDARRKAFQRALGRLAEARKIRQEGDFVWRL